MGDLEAIVEDGAALRCALVESADAYQRVLELAQDDPVQEVRFGHYRWLVAENWEVTRVLRAAARDDSDEIAEWARAQLPPEQGAYR